MLLPGDDFHDFFGDVVFHDGCLRDSYFPRLALSASPGLRCPILRGHPDRTLLGQAANHVQQFGEAKWLFE